MASSPNGDIHLEMYMNKKGKLEVNNTPSFSTSYTNNSTLSSSYKNSNITTSNNYTDIDDLSIMSSYGDEWVVGISLNLTSKEVMDKIYQSLKKLKFEWKVMNDYHLRCKRDKVFFDVQLLKRDHGYVVDLLKVDNSSVLVLLDIFFDFKNLLIND
jgi:hypothetical protein